MSSKKDLSTGKWLLFSGHFTSHNWVWQVKYSSDLTNELLIKKLFAALWPLIIYWTLSVFVKELKTFLIHLSSKFSLFLSARPRTRAAEPNLDSSSACLFSLLKRASSACRRFSARKRSCSSYRRKNTRNMSSSLLRTVEYGSDLDRRPPGFRLEFLEFSRTIVVGADQEQRRLC